MGSTGVACGIKGGCEGGRRGSVTILLTKRAHVVQLMSVSDGNKVTATVVGASAVTVAGVFVAPGSALAIIATYFGFLGGLVMGHVI